MGINKEFWFKKKVLVTGHTGFKGSWLVLLLHKLGCEVFGYALEPPTDPSLFIAANIEDLVNSQIADIRDYGKLLLFIQSVKPEIIFHLAAQPIVRKSYKDPIETYQINVMGTVNLLETIRKTPGIKAVINITTDKCYENREWHWGYRENEPMGGFDPYSNSKGCSELVTAAYRSSFFNPKEYQKHGVGVASARAGNVIGGGDWAEDRLIPDFIRAIDKGIEVKIRSPYAIRPWQHVLEPLTGYLMLAENLFNDGPRFSEAWNFGPNDDDAKNVQWIANRFSELWENGFTYTVDKKPQPHESSFLKLDCSKAKAELGWYPRQDIEKALKSTVEWYKVWLNHGDLHKFTLQQINEYLSI